MKLPKPNEPAYAWVILVVGTLAMFVTIPASPPGFAPYVDFLMTDLGIERGLLGTAFLIGTVSAGLFMPQMGRWIDRFGSRRISIWGLLLLGAVLIAFGFLDRIQNALASWFGGPDLIALVLLTFGFGALRVFGLGVVMNACRTMIFRWFVKRRGVAAGLNGTVLSLMFSASPVFLNFLIVWFGWRGSWWLMGSLIATVVVVGVALTFRDSPESCGVRVPGMDLDGEADDATGIGAEDRGRDYTVAEARRTAAFWIFLGGLAVNVLIGTGVAFNVVSIGEVLGGMTRDQALGVFIPSAIFNVLTVLGLGAISGRIRMRWVHYVMMFAQVVNVLGILNFASPVGFLMFAVGNGVAWGAFGIMISVPWPRFYGRSHLGELNGIVTGVTVVASGLGPPLFGMSWQYLGSYLPILACCLIGTLVMALAGGWAINPKRLSEPRDQGASA